MLLTLPWMIGSLVLVSSGEGAILWASVRLIHTGNTAGFIAACGCAGGGLAGGETQKATILKGLVAVAKGPAVLVDAGNLAPDLRKAAVVLEFPRQLKYDAVLLSSSDRALGLRLSDFGLRGGEKVAEGVYALVVEVGQTRLGLAGLEAAEGAWSLAEAVAGLKRLRGRCDVLVVFSRLPQEGEARLLETEGASKAIDLLISCGSVASVQPAIRNRAGSKLRTSAIPLTPGSRDGRSVGVIDVTFDGNGHPSFESRLVLVDAKTPEDPGVAAIVEGYYAKEAQRLLDASLPPMVNWAEKKYVPATECVECHPKEHRSWLETKHAKAVETLRAKGRLVPECLPCHSEFYRRYEKFNPNAKEGALGVECASCHADGILHSLTSRKDQVTGRPKEPVCRECHTPEHSPRFRFGEYVKGVRHNRR